MKKLIFHLIHGRQARYGDWILTSTGRQLWPSDPRAGDFDVGEIAHNLSLVCRFTGSVAVAYPVSSHSVMVQEIIRDCGGSLVEQLQGLMHDAPESIISDIPAPIKRFLPDVVKAEKKIWKAMAEQFGVPEKMSPLVKAADRISLITERRDLMPDSPHAWKGYDNVKPISSHVKIMSAKSAEKLFLERFHHLRSKMISQSAECHP